MMSLLLKTSSAKSKNNYHIRLILELVHVRFVDISLFIILHVCYRSVITIIIIIIIMVNYLLVVFILLTNSDCLMVNKQSEARFPFKRNRLKTKTARNASDCVGKQPIMVDTASTEHSYWLALAFAA